jgi:SAM-dependent methyltransferase
VCQLDQGGSGFQKTGIVSAENLKEIRNAIRNKYAGVSITAAGKFQYPTGKDGAIVLGYDPDIIRDAAPSLLESFCGVGNPFSLGKIQPGDAVLDLGCGAGFDLFVASRLVGDSGRVCGVDLTEEMVERAKDSLAGANISNVEIKKVDSENIPYADSTFDVVISNGVINLSPNKNICFREIYRVLKSGGRLQFADVILENALPEDLTGSLEAWSQ